MTFGTLVHRPVARRPVPSFDRLVADLYRDLGARPSSPTRSARPVAPRFEPRVAAEEGENAYRVVAELPGVDVADLDVSVEDGVLTIRGERYYGAPLVTSDAAAEADVEEVAATAEGEAAATDAATAAPEAPARPSAKFERKFRFPTEVVETAVVATLKNGMLTVVVPKEAEVKPEVRTIPVEAA
jgi:HSP20 family protein